MNNQDLKAQLAALKATAQKGQKQFIDLIQKMLDGRVKVKPNKTFARLVRIRENKPIVFEVVRLLCQFGLALMKHEAVGDILQLLRHYLTK